MERREAFDNLNRNTKNILNNLKSKLTRNNVVAPEILVSHVWMQEDEPSGVEIIELNSSTESESPEEYPSSHAWNADRLFQVHENNYYEMNKIAREKRLNDIEKDFAVKYGNFYYEDDSEDQNRQFEDVSDFCEVMPNHQLNCFTILNNHITKSDSTTSSDQEYGTIEVIVDPEVPVVRRPNANYWDHVYKEGDATLEATTAGENRAIWIYSFKNKHLLSEHDLELVNIENKGAISSASSSSTSSEDKRNEKSVYVSRIGSPIPAAYIPRLNLSLGQTLSTVTEISEVKHSGDCDNITRKLNNKSKWFADEIKERNKEIDAPSATNNIIEWMALSPIERRRRFKITEFTNITDNKEPDGSIYMEGDRESNVIDIYMKTPITTQVQVNVDVHAIDEEIILAPDDENSISIDENENTLSEQTATESRDTTYVIPNVNFSNDDEPIENMHEIRKTKSVPAIKLHSAIDRNTISSPIQKLDSQNWILEEKIEKERANVDCSVIMNNINDNDKETSTEEITCKEEVSRRLYAQNLKLLGTGEWHSYRPIIGSPPSLEFTLSDSSIGRKSLLQRMARCFNRCCR